MAACFKEASKRNDKVDVSMTMVSLCQLFILGPENPKPEMQYALSPCELEKNKKLVTIFSAKYAEQKQQRLTAVFLYCRN